MRLGGTLRAWIGNSVHSTIKVARRSRRAFSQAKIASAAVFGIEPLEKRTMLTATPLYWNPSGATTAAGGSGTWNTTTAEWSSGSPTGSLIAWSNSGDSNGPYEAVFPGSNGTVTLAVPVTAASLSFTAANVALVGGSGSDILTFSLGAGLPSGRDVDVANGSVATISAGLSDGAGLTKTSAGILNLTGTVTRTTRLINGHISLATGELDIQQGTVTVSATETWSTVDVEASGAMVIQGSAAISVGGDITVDGTINHLAGTIEAGGLTIDSTGTFTDSGGSMTGGSLLAGPSEADLAISNAGLFDAVTDQSLASTSGTFDNSGTYEVDNTSGSGTTTLSMAFTNSDGTINVAGGTLSIPGSISFDDSFILTLEGSGTLAMPSLDDVDSEIDQNSGTLSISGQVSVGDQGGSGAQYDLAGGTLDAGALSIGCFSTATFTQTGGVLSTGHTEVGSFGTGTLVQSGGTSTYYDMYFGIYGVGTFNLSGGSSTASTIADGRLGYGTINLTGTASLTATNWLDVGDQDGLGTLTQSGTSTLSTGVLSLGGSATGTYTISSGTVECDWLGVGYGVFGNGTFAQSGGTVAVTYAITIGAGSSTTYGSYVLSGGQLANGYNVNIGQDEGVGSFIQSGGSADFGNGSLIAGIQATSATVNLSGGSLSVSDDVYIGYSSAATLTQTGGTLNVGSDLIVSGDGWTGDPAGIGTYLLSGTGQIVSSRTIVGYTAAGTFNQSGGTHTTTQLILSGPDGSIGSYNHSGGTQPSVIINVLQPSASGASFVNEGSSYSLGLSATYAAGNNAISSWTVAWGDGLSGQYPGSANAASHTYYNGGNSYTINSTAYGGGASFSSSPVNVLVNDVPANIASIANQSVNTGSTLSISTAFTDPGSNETHTGVINWGDGTSLNATIVESGGTGTVTASHIYQAHGSYSATLQVTDSANAVAVLPFNVTALYVAPSLSMVVPSQNFYTNTPFTIALHDLGPETTGVNMWQINWGDGAAIETISSLPGSISTTDAEWDVPYEYTSAGTYTIQAVGYDSTGALPAVTGTVTVALQPVSNLAAVASLGTGNQDQVNLTWTNNSNAATGTIIQRQPASSATSTSSSWTTVATLGAGQSSVTDTPPDPTQVYEYQAIATGITGNVPSNLVSVSFSPVVSVNGPSSALVNTPLTLTSAAVAATGTSDPLEYSWSVSQNGSPVAFPSGTVTNASTLQWTPTAAGPFNATLTVTDPDFATSATVSTPAAPVGSLSLSATCVSSSELILNYSSSSGQQLQLEEYNPLTLTYQAIAGFPTSGSGSFPVQGLQHSTHYDFRLRGTSTNGEVQYVTAFGHTMAASTEGVSNGGNVQYAAQFVSGGETPIGILPTPTSLTSSVGDQGELVALNWSYTWHSPYHLVARVTITSDPLQDPLVYNNGGQVIPQSAGQFYSSVPIVETADHQFAVYIPPVMEGQYDVEVQLALGSQATAWAPVAVNSNFSQLYVAPTNLAVSFTGSTTNFSWSGPSSNVPYSGPHYTLYGVTTTNQIKVVGTASTGTSLSLNSNSVILANLRSVFVDQNGPEYGYLGKSNILPFSPKTAGLTATSGPLFATQTIDTGEIVVAQFSGDPSGNPAQFTSEINWGDGDLSFGSITSTGTGVWNVSGDHTYSIAGNYTIDMSLHDSAGNFASTSTSASVSELEISGSGTTIDPVAGQPFSGTVALISNRNLSIGIGDFQAIINWGDGSSTQAGTIVEASSSGGYAVTGTHTYTAAQSYNIEVDISYVGSDGSLPVGSTAVVSAANSDNSAMDLTATATITGTVNLAWVPDNMGESGYEVDRRFGQDSWQNLGWVSPEAIPGDTLHFADTTALPDTLYEYQVQGFTGSASSPTYVSTSNTFAATTVPLNAVFSSTPIDTIAVSLNDAPVNPNTYATVTSHISLAEGVEYELVASGYFFLGSWEVPHLADAEWTAFDTSYGTNQGRRLSVLGAYNFGIGVDDTTVDGNKYPYWGPFNGTTHTYAIEFVGTGAPITLNYHDDYYSDNVAEAGAPSLQVQIFPLAPSTPVLTATADNADETIQLSWQGSPQDATSYSVLRSEAGGGWTDINDSNAPLASYNDSSAVPGVSYQYKLLITMQSGAVETSNIVSAALSTADLSVAITGNPVTVAEDQPIDLAAVTSGFPEEGTTYLWNIQRTDNGVMDPITSNLTLSTLDLTLSQDGTYEVTVSASNGSSTAQSAPVTFTVVPGAGEPGIEGSLLNEDGTVSALLDADNNYALFYGNADGSDMTLVGHRQVGKSASWSTTEGYTFNPSANDYIYVTAWNYGGQRMMMGEFSLADGTSVITQSGSWQYTVSTNPNPYNNVDPTYPSTEQVSMDAADATWANTAAAAAPYNNTLWVWGKPPYFASSVQAIWSDSVTGNSDSDLHYVVFRSLNPIAPDSGLAGWTVFIDENHNGALDPGEPSTTTDANGNYSFADLSAGTYWIAEQPKSGWTASDGIIEQQVTIGASGASRINFINQHGTVASPTGLQANVASTSQIDLQWNSSNTSGATYNVYRSQTPDFTPNLITRIASGLSQNEYTDTSISSAGQYYYAVSVVENGVASFPSAIAGADCLQLPTLPAAPTGLNATARSSTEIELDWKDLAVNEAGYTLQRAEDSAFTSDLTTITLPAQSQQYIDTGLVAGTNYYYRICSFNHGGSSSYVLAQQATMPPGTNLPPTVAIPATVASTFWTGTNADLSVLGADDGGESNLTYTWSIITAPPGAQMPVFANLGYSNINGTNGAKLMTVNLFDTGTYTFNVVISDGTYSVVSSVTTTVLPNPKSVTVYPSVASVRPGETLQFQAVAVDQFGHGMASQPLYEWSVPDGEGTIDSNGLFTAGSTISDAPFSITASIFGGNASASASVEITANQPPTVSVPTATATDQEGVYTLAFNATSYATPSDLTYAWGVVSGVLGEPLPAIGPNPVGTYIAEFAAPGTYVLMVTATDSGGLSGSNEVTVNVPAAVALVPTTLTVTPISNSIIELQWPRVDDSYGYVITRTNPDGTSIVLQAPGTVTTSDPCYDQGLLPGTAYSYSYQVVDQFGGISAPSNTASTTTFALPTAPTGLRVVADSPSELKLTWDDGRTDNSQIAGWDILRATTGSPTAPPQTAYQSLLNAGITDPSQLQLNPTTYYIDDNVSVGTYYWYEVVAYENSGYGSAPSVAVDGTPSPLPAPPPAPTNLVGGYAGSARVNLQWNYSGSTQNLLGFDIYRYQGISLTDPNGEQFTVVGAAPVGSEALIAFAGLYGDTDSYGYTDDQIPSGYFFYKVVAVADDGDGGELDSNPSLFAAVNTAANPSSAPPAPSNPSAVSALDSADQWNNSVTLSWQDNSVDETGFDIYRKDVTASGAWKDINSITARSTSYVDTQVVANNSYEYFIAAINAADYQNPSTPTSPQSSPTASVMTPVVGAPPNAPSDLEVDGTSTDTAISLQWTAPVANGITVQDYLLFRSPTGLGQFSPVEIDGSAIIPSTDTTITDSSLPPGTAFDYRLVAVSSTNTQSNYVELDDVSTAVAAADLPPVVMITAPASSTEAGVAINWNAGSSTDNRITAATQVRGIIDDLDNDLQSWSLILTPLNTTADAQPITLATNMTVGQLYIGSSISNTAGPICMLDPSQFPSGQYTLTLQATALPTGSTQPISSTSNIVQVSLASNLQLGNLTLPFTDLSVNVPGGQPITASRVYNSQQANVLGDFGYGWSLDTSTATVTNTATPAEVGDAPSFQPGDLVYVTLPGGQQYTFQFFPVTASYNSLTAPDPYDATYAGATYTPRFISADGSHATLSVPDAALTYQADSYNHPVFVDGIDTYGPTSIEDYELTTSDGTTYDIDPSNNQLTSITTANGNVTTYSDGQISENGMTLVIDRDGPSGTINQIYLANSSGGMIGQPINYNVSSSSLNLLSIQDQLGNVTQFQYNDPNNSHYLTGVTNSAGVQVVTAAYNNQGELTSLTNSLNNQSSIGNGGFNGDNAAETVNEPGQAATQDIYDQYGNVIRHIQTVTQNGVVTGYNVTVTAYKYSSSDVSLQISNIFQTPDGSTVPAGISYSNQLQYVSQYQSFFVPGQDLGGDRYSLQPTLLLNSSSYDLNSNLGEQKTYLSTSADGQENTYSIVSYSDYVLGKPQDISESIETDNASTGAEISSKTVSSTVSTYDASGNLSSTVDASGVETDYKYETAGDGISAGSIGSELRDGQTVSVTTYYESDKPTAGGIAGLPRYTVQNGQDAHVSIQATQDAAGEETYYAYDAAGNTILDYTLKARDNSDGSSSTYWVGTTTQYDAANRPIATWECVYLNLDNNDDPKLGTDYNSDGQVIVTNALYSGFNGGEPLLTSQTTYTTTGQTATSTDQYGAVTRYTYDANGNLLRTFYPDGTEVRSVYDSLNRIIWQTDRYKTNTVYNESTGVYTNDNITAALATETIYNSLGQVTSTLRMSGVVFSISTLSTPTITVSSEGNQFSNQQSFYNNLGQVAETISPSGLRTGTIYYANGSVEYTGPLLNDVSDAQSDPWYNNLPANPDPAQYFSSYTTSLYNQVDASGNLYDEVIDQNGHSTETYKDSSGRVIETVYPDGSISQTLYAEGSTQIASNVPMPIGFDYQHDLFAGDSLKIEVGQHQPGDTNLVYTYYLYDLAGNLTDVYEPLVEDPSTGKMVNPQWHYTYNAVGEEVTQTDPNDHVTTFGYDEMGNKIMELLPDGEMQTWSYNAYGNLVLHKVYGQTDGTTNTTASQTTYDVYSTASDGTGGQLLGEYRFIGDVNPTGSSPSGYAEKTIYTYDSMGRQATVTDYTSSGESTSKAYTYDPITGQQASITSTVGTTTEGTVNYVYDPGTSLLIETWTGTSHGTATNDVLYGYDAQGRLKSVTQVKLNGATPSAVAATVRYDADGGAIPTTMPTTLYSYDAVGDLTQDSEPDGISTDYTYNSSNQLTDELAINTVTNEPGFREHYDLDSNGDGLKQDEIDTNYSASGGVVSKIEYNWTYDAEQRLTEEELTVLSGSGANVPTPYTDVFTYDQANNRTEEDIDGGDSLSGGQSIRYVYNNDDQLTAETETAYSSPGNTTQTYQTTYTFDGNGNLSTENRTGTEATSNTYTYDIRNRMITAVINGVTTTYGYDTNGVLIGETTGNASSYYLNDPNNPTGYTKAIQESSTIGGAPTRSYVLGSKVEAQSDSTNGTLYLVTDGHGSTRALVNSAGTVAERYDYDAYGTMILGQHISSTGTVTNVTAATAATEWQFAGDGLYDPATGWTYHLARWDNGFWFTTSDFGGYGSTSDPLSLHKYLYAGGDSINNWDPSGHDFSLVELALDAGISNVLGSVTSLAIKPAVTYFQNAIASALIPSSFIQTASSLLPDAIDFGVSGSADIGVGALKTFGIGLQGSVGLDLLWSPKSHNAAVYGELSGGATLHAGQAGVSVGVTGSLGLVWNCKDSNSFEGYSGNVTLPATVLKQWPGLYAKVVSGLSDTTGLNALIDKMTESGMDEEYAAGLKQIVAENARISSLLASQLQNFSVTFSLGSTPEISLNYTKDDSTDSSDTLLAAGWTEAGQEYPNGNVSFR